MPPTPADPIDPTADSPPLPALGLLTAFRLGLFQMGLGIMSVLTLGLLNRVMVSELRIPLDVTAGAIAMHQFIAPVRVWFGQISDARPLRGYHRTGYIWLGAVAFSTIAFVAVQMMWRLGAALPADGTWAWTAETTPWALGLGAVFAAYGVAISCSSTPFVALLVDVSEEEERSKVVGIVWSMLMVGIVIGAITTAAMLKGLAKTADLATVQAGINRLFMILPAAVVGLAVVGTWGVERKYSRYRARLRAMASPLAGRDDQITLGRALKLLTANRQTGLFFSFLLAMTLGLFLQEAVLENYGAEVFQMPIADTTQLNAFFGVGTLAGLSLAGFVVVPRLGKQRTAKYGCLAVAIVLGALVVLGSVTQHPDPAVLQQFPDAANPLALKAGVGLFGLASGITTTGAISLMLDLTSVEAAGTFIGAWGLAQAIARASSTFLGGWVFQNLGKSIFPSQPVLAYGTVFGLEILAMLTAIVLLGRVNPREFQTDTRTAIARVVATELD